MLKVWLAIIRSDKKSKTEREKRSVIEMLPHLKYTLNSSICSSVNWSAIDIFNYKHTIEMGDELFLSRSYLSLLKSVHTVFDPESKPNFITFPLLRILIRTKNILDPTWGSYPSTNLLISRKKVELSTYQRNNESALLSTCYLIKYCKHSKRALVGLLAFDFITTHTQNAFPPIFLL